MKTTLLVLAATIGLTSTVAAVSLLLPKLPQPTDGQPWVTPDGRPVPVMTSPPVTAPNNSPAYGSTAGHGFNYPVSQPTDPTDIQWQSQQPKNDISTPVGPGQPIDMSTPARAMFQGPPENMANQYHLRFTRVYVDPSKLHASHNRPLYRDTVGTYYVAQHVGGVGVDIPQPVNQPLQNVLNAVNVPSQYRRVDAVEPEKANKPPYNNPQLQLPPVPIQRVNAAFGNMSIPTLPTAGQFK